MAGPVTDLSINLLATGLGAAMAHSAQRARTKIRKQATRKRIGDFFGRAGEKILVVHSSIYDEPERAYNYPATDTRSARILAQFFEESNLREGLDFTIVPDRGVVSESCSARITWWHCVVPPATHATGDWFQLRPP